MNIKTGKVTYMDSISEIKTLTDIIASKCPEEFDWPYKLVETSHGIFPIVDCETKDLEDIGYKKLYESEDFIIMTDGAYTVAVPLNDDWLSFEPII